MAQGIRMGIIGGGWPGVAHARGCEATAGFTLAAVADLIPQRRAAMMRQFKIPTEYAEAHELLASPDIDAVSVCLPNHLHAPVAIAALKAGKHVLCEAPPALNAKEARQMEAAAAKAGKVLAFGFQRRFGAAEQAARQVVEKGYAGAAYHARAAWTRTRGIPVGTGWFTEKNKAGGGALIDLGAHMLDLAWYLLGQPKPASAFAVTHRRLIGGGAASPGVAPDDDLAGDSDAEAVPPGSQRDGRAGDESTGASAAAESPGVEDAAFALIRFENDACLELAASWALNQPPHQNGTVCRVHGEQGVIDVYTAGGPIVHRHFDAKGDSRPTPLKLPKIAGYAAMMRHFRECVLGKASPLAGPSQAVTLMQMIDALYKSAQTQKSVSMGA